MLVENGPCEFGESSILNDSQLQNNLLEIGWNKSEDTQRDVEKTLNCCGYSTFNPNSTCAAVSESPSISVTVYSAVINIINLWISLSVEMPWQPFTGLWHLLKHHPAVRRGGAAVCGGDRTLLQFHRGQWRVTAENLCLKNDEFLMNCSWYLFFIFQILGVWLAHRYRNIKDPRSNPGAFL